MDRESEYHLPPRRAKRVDFPAVEHKDRVEFYARLVHAGDGSAEGLPRNAARVLVVLGSQIVGEERVDAFDAVPRERLKVFFDGVVRPLRRHHGQQGVLELGG